MLCCLRSSRRESVDVTNNSGTASESSGAIAEFNKAVSLFKTKKMILLLQLHFCTLVCLTIPTIALMDHICSYS
ncbi:hypothetical protein TNCT_268501 [Trichonephila clavata]|uniref:Uncharacterized protein n=1 Tax=Trichonephila clavata TaxID=2740835 RepID=A0A8X6F021_TRICU|nr:hypothetical protein TNCT_268501 [Trichonephila clavata]